MDPGPDPLPYVEPCPPVTKFTTTCSFDSDFNACLPQRVSLRGVFVERVVAGGGHTIIMGRRVQRRFGQGPGGATAHVLEDGDDDDAMVAAEADDDADDDGAGALASSTSAAAPASTSASASALVRDVGALSLAGGSARRGGGSGGGGASGGGGIGSGSIDESNQGSTSSSNGGSQASSS